MNNGIIWHILVPRELQLVFGQHLTTEIRPFPGHTSHGRFYVGSR